MNRIEIQVLSFVSLDPTPLSAIAADLGHANQSQVASAIKMLRRVRGLELITGNGDDGRCVWADARYWPRIRRRAAEAWDTLDLDEEDCHAGKN